MSAPTRYRLLGRLGSGGFGEVYRARLEGPEGFSKDVAIKLLRDAEAPERVIARFRDEARILGLVRDRAVVKVDPPLRLGGHWALVMEYVDGVSCAALLKRGPIPPTVALEIVGEVARALDVVWRQPGPEGEPLQLLHRDLKPANLQVTPTGQVKVLDLGIARARFSGREAATTQRLAGTPGYLAPERLYGVEAPSGDVYSLGVVLHELITGVRPVEHGVEPTFDALSPEGAPVAGDPGIELAREMRCPNPDDRPTARGVEERCRALLAELDGPALRDWAEAHVPAEPDLQPDPRVGAVLSAESRATAPAPGEGGVGLRWLAAAAGALVLGALYMAWVAVPGERPADALEQPFADLVMEANAARSERSELRGPAHWDRGFYDAVVGHVERLVARPGTFERMDQVFATWRDVTLQLREAGMPEVIAGIPWVESRYMPEAQSNACAKGLWQLMPETAVHAARLGVDIEVRDCRFEDAPDALWSPTELAPLTPSPYRVGNRCRIPSRHGCAVDGRTDVKASTAAALVLLRPAWEDRDLVASGAVVQLTVAAHLMGYDDAALGQDHPLNVRPSYTAWAEGAPATQHPLFLTAEGSTLAPEGADYAARVVAAHFVAICFYAKHYDFEPAFRDWLKYRDGYCASLPIP